MRDWDGWETAEPRKSPKRGACQGRHHVGPIQCNAGLWQANVWGLAEKGWRCWLLLFAGDRRIVVMLDPQPRSQAVGIRLVTSLPAEAGRSERWRGAGSESGGGGAGRVACGHSPLNRCSWLAVRSARGRNAGACSKACDNDLGACEWWSMVVE